MQELDGFRAVAILGVVAWHYLGMGDGPDSITWKIFRVGASGVDLFFVLSGYLIGKIILEQAERPNFLSVFYGRRAFRILPIYLIVVAVYLVARRGPISFPDPIPWWTYILGIQNFWMAAQQTYGASILAGTWSLAVEEQFYLLFPLMIIFAPRRYIPLALIGLLIVCPIGRAVSFLSYDNEFAYYVLMPLRADVLAIGALVAYLEVSGSISPAVRRCFWGAFLASAMLFPIFAWRVDKSNAQMALWGHTFLVALYGSLLFVVLEQRGSPSLWFLRTRVAGFFARISYALYLTHTFVIMVVFLAAGSHHGHHSVSTPKGAALAAIAFAISVAICAVSYRCIESPLLRFGHRRFAYGSRLSHPDHAGQSNRAC